VLVAFILARRRASRGRPALAGQTLDRFAERQALDMLHEGNDIATPVAPATIPDLLMPIDAEPIAPTADRARPSAFDGCDALQRRVAARNLADVRLLRLVE
jgi:hypothetical protein